MTALRPALLPAAAALLVAASGCFAPYSANPAAQQHAYAAALGGPSHPATTEAQWAALEAQVTGLVEQEYARVGAPVRVAAQGFTAEHRFQVEGGHCYRAATAWAYEAQTQASVYFQRRADGQPVNDSVGGANGRLVGGSGTLQFCADRDGEAVLSLSALGPGGAIANNELLEYAVAIGGKAETPEEQTARRARDHAAGSAARAQIDANVAAAKERERRNLEDRCRKCREEYRLCQVETAYARKHPKPGVTFTTSCERKFGVCATGKYSGTPEEMAQCGAPPP